MDDGKGSGAATYLLAQRSCSGICRGPAEKWSIRVPGAGSGSSHSADADKEENRNRRVGDVGTDLESYLTKTISTESQ